MAEPPDKGHNEKEKAKGLALLLGGILLDTSIAYLQSKALLAVLLAIISVLLIWIGLR